LTAGTGQTIVWVPMPFLSRQFWQRSQREIEAFLFETLRVALLFAGLLSLLAVFRILRAAAVDADFLNTLQELDHLATGIIFVAYLVMLVRRAVSLVWSKADEFKNVE
jgi:hypothetical protein